MHPLIKEVRINYLNRRDTASSTVIQSRGRNPGPLRLGHYTDMAATSINQWKTSGGNSVDIIQQEISLALWRPVPSYSNPAYLIS